MKTCRVRLDSVEKVKKFVEILEVQKERYELISDTFIVDAKSMMGIFCLDLTKPLELRTEVCDLPTGISQFLYE